MIHVALPGAIRTDVAPSFGIWHNEPLRHPECAALTGDHALEPQGPGTADGSQERRSEAQPPPRTWPGFTGPEMSGACLSGPPWYHALHPVSLLPGMRWSARASDADEWCRHAFAAQAGAWPVPEGCARGWTWADTEEGKQLRAGDYYDTAGRGRRMRGRISAEDRLAATACPALRATGNMGAARPASRPPRLRMRGPQTRRPAAPRALHTGGTETETEWFEFEGGSGVMREGVHPATRHQSVRMSMPGDRCSRSRRVPPRAVKRG
ncbi:hypothetical protein BC628DRAFT_1339881 [Trametes gibbosa]|nr:hypothetical protein BC628DRAFT_1339881 [Trametes gibbosa]